MALKVIIPKEKEKILRQIESLQEMIKEDTNDKDRKIHQEALDATKEALKAIEAVEKVVANMGGRPKLMSRELVQKCKAKGMTQVETAKELNTSLSTVRRNWI
jgi:DNA-directed RNA polymerase specialized sigma24 family protein